MALIFISDSALQLPIGSSLWGIQEEEKTVLVLSELKFPGHMILGQIGVEGKEDQLVISKDGKGAVQIHSLPNLFSKEQPPVVVFFDERTRYPRGLLSEKFSVLSTCFSSPPALQKPFSKSILVLGSGGLALTVVSFFTRPVLNYLSKARHLSCFITLSVERLENFRKIPSVFQRALAADGDRARKHLESRLLVLAADIFLGLVVATIVATFSDSFSASAQTHYEFLNEVVLKRGLFAWLDSHSGVRMNRNLTHFIGTIAQTVVDLWQYLIVLGSSLGREVNLWSLMLGLGGICGLSNLIAIGIDIISIVNFHIFFLHIGVTRLWALCLSAIRTTFLLFRGMKMNILKARVDRHAFDLEQLLLGTVFFALFVFLLPTVFVFHMAFFGAWLAVILVQLVLWFIVIVLNSFPFLAIVKRDSQRIPGIHWEISDPVLLHEQSLSSIRLCTSPPNLALTLQYFFETLKYHLPFRVKDLFGVFTGASVLSLYFSTKSSENDSDDALEIRHMGSSIFG